MLYNSGAEKCCASIPRRLLRCDVWLLALHHTAKRKMASTTRFNEYQVIGRKQVTAAEPNPALYRMRIFAPNTVVAKSRFWYFLKQFRKVKKATGQIVQVNQIHEKKPTQVKTFGIWLRYDSRSGTHNMYKEYRELTRTAAVFACYQDMAARHRARFRSVQIIRVAEVATKDVRRPYIQQILAKNLKFPLPHRVQRAASKRHESLFIAKRPSTNA
ncbi:60S ribosomal protein L20B [Blastocladiella emersonii ATCC 22665]|nr:60S ribosomal protein L20B [Blastocladiella emersonii ATCC 22665]